MCRFYYAFNHVFWVWTKSAVRDSTDALYVEDKVHKIGNLQNGAAVALGGLRHGWDCLMLQR